MKKSFRLILSALLILLALTLVLSFAACGSPGQTAASSQGGSALTASSVAPQQAESPTAPTEASAPPPAGLSSAPSVPPSESSPGELLPEDGSYTTKEDVALFIHLYGRLPSNFITKSEAEKLGWSGGGLETYAPGKCIGGNRFGNYEGLLPKAEGRSYTECDIDTLGAKSRGAKRIVFSSDGLIFYTGDHYQSFELLYGEVEGWQK